MNHPNIIIILTNTQ